MPDAASTAVATAFQALLVALDSGTSTKDQYFDGAHSTRASPRSGHACAPGQPAKVRECFLQQTGMKKYFNGAISQRELATIVRGALGAQLALHNTFIRALYTTAEAAAFVEELGPDWRTKIPKEKPLPLRPTNVPQQQPVRPNNQRFSTQRPTVAHPGGGQQRAPAQPKILWRVKYPALGTGAPPTCHASSSRQP